MNGRGVTQPVFVVIAADDETLIGSASKDRWMNVVGSALCVNKPSNERNRHLKI